MPQGTIRSYSESKKFGFISGDSGGSFFFHRNHLKDKGANPEIGQIVSFEEHPTPKGMAAREVVIEQSAQKIHVDADLDGVLVSKSDRCGKGNEVVCTGQTTFVEARNPDEAVQGLKANARKAGFNALINLERTQRSHSGFFDGNYRYTVHKFSATPALVKRIEHTTDKARIAESEEQTREECRRLAGAVIRPEPYGSPAWVSALAMVFIIIVVLSLLSAW